MTDENENNLPVRVETVVERQGDFTVVACNPAEMMTAQKSLILWAARQIQAEKELLNESIEQFEIARKSKWNSSGWSRRISLSEGKIQYYKKIKMALEAGYYIVPPFPIDVFAIRTDRTKPTTKMGFSDPAMAITQGIPSIPLVAGEGEYVSNTVATRTFQQRVKNQYAVDGFENKVFHQPYKFKSVEFPFKLAKAAVMSETARAMALKVFDQLGIMGTTAASPTVPDPIVCGQILPWFHKRQAVTFFVAWWLDTKTL